MLVSFSYLLVCGFVLVWWCLDVAVWGFDWLLCGFGALLNWLVFEFDIIQVFGFSF